MLLDVVIVDIEEFFVYECRRLKNAESCSILEVLVGDYETREITEEVLGSYELSMSCC